MLPEQALTFLSNAFDYLAMEHILDKFLSGLIMRKMEKRGEKIGGMNTMMVCFGRSEESWKQYSK